MLLNYFNRSRTYQLTETYSLTSPNIVSYIVWVRACSLSICYGRSHVKGKQKEKKNERQRVWICASFSIRYIWELFYKNTLANWSNQSWWPLLNNYVESFNDWLRPSIFFFKSENLTCFSQNISPYWPTFEIIS